MTDESSRFASVVKECLKTSTEALGETKRFAEAISKDKNRDGVSLLEVKNRDMIAYMAELSYLMSVMSAGESIQDDPSVFRSAKLRTVLERMRPIEAKMKAQVEKLISSRTGSSQAKTMKPRPELMEVDDAEEEASGSEGEEEGERPKKYVPPKIMAMHYDETEDSKQERAVERAKRRALQSSLIQDLREQYSEAPQEVRDEFAPRRRKIDEEKRQYEEDYFIRLQMTKKEKHEEKMRNRQNLLDEMLSFGDYMATERVKSEGGGKRKGGPGKRKGGPVRGGKDSKRFKGSKGSKGKSKGGKKRR